jgi:hypothetical protein
MEKENLMNKRFPILAIFIAIVLFVTAFGAFVVQAQTSERTAPAAASYEAVLGKSLNDSDGADFIASNRCEGAGQFHLCNAAGMALVTGEGQKVETVYLYPNASAGFAAYNGTLPLGLSADDTMASVEDKFGQPKVSQAPQAGWVPGVPDQSGTPDHIHTWAVYKRFGLTIVYNSPSATDKGATIHAILVSK